MIIIPAIDIKDGKCVRLTQGDMDKETIYFNSPLKAAKHWVKNGAKMLHIVDLNGAVDGIPKNLHAIHEIADNIDVPIQVGGGIRNIDTIEAYLSFGVKRIILGTSAVSDPKFANDVCKRYKEKVLIGIDARDDMVAIDGWTKGSGVSVADLIKKFEGSGIAGIIYTDIKKDGMLKGPNIENIKKIAKGTKIPIIASGGVSTAADIAKLKKLEEYGVCGVIIGKALYAGMLSLEDALQEG